MRRRSQQASGGSGPGDWQAFSFQRRQIKVVRSMFDIETVSLGIMKQLHFASFAFGPKRGIW